MQYQEAMDYIDSCVKFGLTPTMERIERLLDAMGNPQQACKVIHIAGTNGKGSCASMVKNGLTECGYKTGLFTSPFIERFTERIVIDDQEIREAELIEEVECIKPIVEALQRQGMEITQFDMITAIAFHYFAKNNCDYCVMEVGLGGRLDSTNVVKNPVVTAIMSISFDHTAILGNTLAKIATQKAGIIKKDTPVVCYPYWKREVEETIFAVAKEKNAPVFQDKKEDITEIVVTAEGTSFLYKGSPIHLRLIGAHQAYNFSCVYGVMKCLPCVDEQLFLRGVSKTEFLGRFQQILKTPSVFIDGGHNAEGVDVIVKSMKAILQGKRLIVIMGMMADKDTHYCVAQMAQCASVFIGVMPHNERAKDSQAVCDIAKKHCTEVYNCKEISLGVQKAFDLWDENTFILGCGSLYLLGDMKREIARRQN